MRRSCSNCAFSFPIETANPDTNNAAVTNRSAMSVPSEPKPSSLGVPHEYASGSRRASRRLHFLVLIGWIGLCVLGYFLLMQYDFRPGAIGAPLGDWPTESAIAPVQDKMNLLVFIHPRCGCTEATIKELIGTLRGKSDIMVTAVTYLPRPNEADPVWTNGKYIQTIRSQVAPMRLVLDSEGVEARRFGVSTSGTIVVFDRACKEVFRGGITSRRGAEGDSLGKRRLERLLSGEKTTESEGPNPVFGCSFENCETGAPGGDQGGDR